MPPADPAADLDTFPKLLARNARDFEALPAYREKEYGIWQSWTWGEVEAEVLALAAGFEALGLGAGDHLAIIGRNRPHLYRTMVAAQKTVPALWEVPAAGLLPVGAGGERRRPASGTSSSRSAECPGTGS